MEVGDRAGRVGVELHHPRRRSGAAAPAPPRSRSARLSRLPIGRRRATGSSPDTPSRIGLIAVPRLAPSTRAKAASGGTAPLAANDITSSTTATEECAAQVRPAATSTSSTGSVVIAPSTRRRLGTSSYGVTSETSWCSAISIRPRPIATRPRSRVRAAVPRRNSITPSRISAGATSATLNDKQLHDQRGADIGAQHDGERRHQRHGAAGGEARHHQPGRGAALQDGGDAEAGGERGQPVAQRGAEPAAQIGAEAALDAGLHHVQAPQQQRHRAGQVEQGPHRRSVPPRWPDIWSAVSDTRQRARTTRS